MTKQLPSVKKIGVFISYKSEDRFIAQTLAEQLREVGYQPWVDVVGIEGGEQWKRSIETGLENSAVFLALMTPQSMNSRWVNYEIEQAMLKNRPVIPLMIRTCKIPPILESLHYVDFRHDPKVAFKSLQRALLSVILRNPLTLETTAAETALDLNAPLSNEAPTQLSIKTATSTDELAQYIAQVSEDDTVVDVPSVATVEASTTGMLVLVVEDAVNYQELLRDFFVEEGFAVHIARTRNEAITYLTSHRYHLVTLDMRLGPDDERDEQGLYLLDLIQRKQGDVPVIMITHMDYDKRQTSEFFNSGRIKGMLDKPFNHNDLRTLVNKHVRGAER